jgi:type VI secretion system protein ImpJ
MREKVIWAEGILLGQQHLQCWDGYWQEQLQYCIQMIPFAWGIQHIEIDSDALLNAQFRVRKLNAILPQGIWLSYDYFRDQEKVLACELDSQPDKTLSIYLGIANNPLVKGVTGYCEPKITTSRDALYQKVLDELDPLREREILLGKLNLKLFTDLQNREGFYTLKIAEVRNSGRVYEEVANFIPTAICLRATRYLTDLLIHWREIVFAKICLLKENCNVQNLQNLVLAKILHGAYVELDFLHHHRQFHPHYLFLVINRLIAELIIFSEKQSIKDLPSYQHDDLTNGFLTLDLLLTNLLLDVLPKESCEIRLIKMNDSLYTVKKIASQIFDNNDFFMGIYCVADDPGWILQFLRQVKICSIESLDDIMTSALPGVKLIHMQRPPNKLVTKAGYEYCYLEPNGEFWQQIKINLNLAIFLPIQFNQLKLELVTVEK